MTKKLRVALVVVSALLLLTAILPYLFSVNRYRATLEQFVSDRAGLTFEIRGDIHFSLLPRIALRLNDVWLLPARAASLTAEEKSALTPLLSAESIDVALQILPLLQGRTEIDRVQLDTPVVNVIRAENGHTNWAHLRVGGEGGPFELAEPDAASAEATPDESDALGSAPAWLSTLSVIELRDFTIRNGALHYLNSSEQSALHLAHLDLSTALSSEANPLTLSATIESSALPRPAQLSMKGMLHIAPSKIAYESVTLTWDDIKAYAHFIGIFNDVMPKIKAGLDAEELDLRPYLSGAEASSSLLPLIASAHAEEGSSTSGLQPWSTEPFDFSWMHQLDAYIGIRTKKLITPTLTTGKISTNFQLQNGKLSVLLKEAELYGGSATGSVYVDSSDPLLRLSGRLSVKEVNTANIQPAPFPALSFLQGKITTEGEWKAYGNSERALIDTLEGSLFLKVTEGTIRGVDIAAMISNVSGAFDSERRSQSSTSISDASATFVIERGVMRGDDLVLKTPLLAMRGKGLIHLPDQTIDYRLDPELLPSASSLGIRIPLLIRGPLSAPVVTPDIERTVKDLLKNTGQVQERLQEKLQEQLGGKVKLNVKDIRVDKEGMKQIQDEVGKRVGKELNKWLGE